MSSTPGSTPEASARSSQASSDEFDPLLRQAARLTPLPGAVPLALRAGVELCRGRLQVRRRIGAGGMGVVYEAFDRDRGCPVAVKTLVRLDAASLYRLKHEFRALAEVTHPNLVQLHELFGDDGIWLFTMELVEGASFDRAVRPAGRLEAARLRAALPQLFAGVQAIHASGKLHRDLKPSNVLVTAAGRVVVLDFGLAAEPQPGGAGQTLADEWLPGTPAYMAPELFAGAGSSQASDLYAVGVTLFEALTGRLPFEGGNERQAQQKLNAEAPRASALEPAVPADLERLCSQLLSRVPEARPDASRIAELLSSAAGGARSSFSQPPPRAPELLGRDHELARLREAYEHARAGQAVVARVTGESGIGKSALVGALLEELRADGRAVLLSGRCYERESLPYKAFDRVVDELTRYLRRLRDVDVAALLPRDAAALARLFPVLGRVELIANAPPRASGDAQALRRHAFDAFAELLARIRDRGMLVLHIDDLQWLDHDSLLLLEHLFGQAEPAPFLFIAGYRAAGSEQASLLARLEASLRAKRRIAAFELALGPLALEPARELAGRLLGQKREQALVEVVAVEAGGSPFLLSELARYAADAGERAEASGLSLEQAVRGRALRLGDDACRMLELLAIAGRPTPVDVLTRAAGVDGSGHAALERLRAVQLVRDAGAGNYECCHDRIRAALAERVAAADARAYRERLATAWSDRGDPDPEVLFEYCLLSGQRERAGEIALEAAQKAGASLAFERSAAFLGQAIELLPAAEVARLNLRERRAEALSRAGRYAEAAEAYADAGQRSRNAQRKELLQLSALHFLGSGRGAEGLPRLREIFEAAGLRWPRTRVFALASAFATLGWLWLTGAARKPNNGAQAGAGARPDSAVALGTQRLDRWLEAAGLVPPYDHARGVYFMAGFARRALRSGDVAYQALALGMLAAMFSSAGPSRRVARRLAAEASALAREHAVTFLASATLSFSAWVRFLDAQLGEALALSVQAEELLRSSGRSYVYELWTARALQAFALMALGRVREAAERYAENAQLAREVGDDLAVIGGDSVFRHLVVDDLPRARELVEHKNALLSRAVGSGGLHELVQNERMLCELYQGRGGERMDSHEKPEASRFALVDSAPLRAFCALQGLPARARGVRGLVRKTLRVLRRRRGVPSTQGTIAQLEAALFLMDGDADAALGRLETAEQRFRSADMALHVAVMRWRRAALRGGREAEGEIDAMRRFMQSQGIARPEAWVGMLAPGLGPRASQSRYAARE